MVEKEHQISMDDMDITYSSDGLTLSGRIKSGLGPDAAEKLRKLAGILLDAAAKVENMEPIEEVRPTPVNPAFGKAFD